MATDVTTITKELKIDTFYVDGDTRVITLKNPKTTITDSEIEELETFIQTNNLLVGDKNGATFGRITTVDRVTTTTTDYGIDPIS